MTPNRLATYISALGIAVFAAMPLYAQAIDGGIATEIVDFDESDVQATRIARQMYGKEFSHVRAVRVWLEPPSNDPEQLMVELGNGRDCAHDCIEVALFYNDQWLEIFRQPKANRLALSEVSPTGMKSIIADDRVWSWNARAYVPEPIQDSIDRRDATEQELSVVAEQLSGVYGSDGLNAFGPPKVDVYDVDMNGYLGKIIAVRSPAVCGQSTCPIYLLNGEDQIFRVLRSIEGEVGLSRTHRDEQGFRGIELLTRNGISIVSSTSGKLLSSVPVQAIHVAGRSR